MKILVTGSNGFIGKKLCQHLINAGHQLIGIDIQPSKSLDLFEPGQYEFMQLDLNSDELCDFASWAVDVVVHLAISMRPGKSQTHDELLTGTHNLLNAVAKASTPYLLAMSSLSVLDFDSMEASALIDESCRRCTEFDRMGRYAALKSKQEEVFTEFANQHSDTKTVIVRPGLVYQDTIISDAYAGILKSNIALLVSHDGEIPLIELDALLRGVVATISVLDRLPSTTIIHFVNDTRPNQEEYIQTLMLNQDFPRFQLLINWRLLSIVVNTCYRAFKWAGLHQYLPDLFKPQAFATRLKPFTYTNIRAQQLLDWSSRPRNSH